MFAIGDDVIASSVTHHSKNTLSARYLLDAVAGLCALGGRR
jgi:hypothetical protein